MQMMIYEFDNIDIDNSNVCKFFFQFTSENWRFISNKIYDKASFF